MVVSLESPLAGGSVLLLLVSQHAGADHGNHKKAISSVIGSHWMTAGRRQDGDRTKPQYARNVVRNCVRMNMTSESWNRASYYSRY